MNRKLQLSAGLSFAAVMFLPATMVCQANKHDPQDYPRSEVFLGYSYLRAVPTLADGNRLVTLNGGSASLAYNVNRYFGLVTDFSGFADSQLRLSGPGAVPTRIVDSKGSAYTFLFGPRLSYRAHRFTPFAQVLGGGAYATSVTVNSCTNAPCTPLPEQGSFAMTAGGGLDINLSRHVAVRAVQAEYLMTRFADVTTTTRGTQNDMRLSAGIVFRFGNHPSPMMAMVPANRAPVSVCSVDKPLIYAGTRAVVVVRVRAVDADGDALTYTWLPGDGTFQGTGPEVQWDLTQASVGTHTMKIKVDDSRGGISDCSADVVIAAAPNRSPEVSCSVAEPSIEAGQIAHITAVASDPDGDTLHYAWTTTPGTLSGTGNAVALQTESAGGRPYLVRVHVTDERGGAADCSVSLSVARSAEIVKLEARLALRSIYFPTAEPTVEQPSRGLVPSQDRTLNSLAADFSQYLKSRPEARLVLEGHADPRGSDQYNQKLSELRVALTKQYLVGQGVPAANIDIEGKGDQQNLTDAQVKDAIARTPELSDEARRRLMLNMKVIVLASNRRVDVTLSTTDQHSLRQYPFNAGDSMTLLSEQRPSTSARHAVKAAHKQ